jgi:ferredoxin-NADP reductase
VASYETVLTRREPVAEGTMAFHFARPAGFAHAAGQNVLVTLLAPPQTDSQGDSRTFTLASAPHEPELMVATRMRDSAFKRVLKSAASGTPVRIEGPNGLMVLHEDAARPAVFLAGGIGVTPFLSMARRNGETDMIGRELLERSLRDVKAPVYYFAGPPGMTMAMQSMLESMGVAENDMRSEEFYGY